MNHRYLRTLVVVIATVHVSVLFGTEAPTPKAPVPSTDAQEEILATVKEVYGEEYKKATTADQRIALAKKLVQKAAESKTDRAAHFVLLRLARDVAATAGDADTAIRAVEEIAATYEVDAYPMLVEAVTKTARAANSTAQRTAIVEYSLDLVDEALQADDFDDARSLIELALTAARKDAEKIPLRPLLARRQQIEEAAARYAQFKSASAVLEKTPEDPAANLAAGKYLCFVHDDWERGLPMLGRGNDAELKELAARDFAGPTDADAQVLVADGWWELGAKADGLAQLAFSTRAEHWYRKALPALTGLAKAKAEKRLAPPEEIAAKPPMHPARAKRAPKPANRLGTPLFDGKTLKGWHPRDPDKQVSWAVDNGNLVALSRGNSCDLVSDETFQEFELHLEFYLGRGANSGVFLKGLYEIQLYDDTSRAANPGEWCGALWKQTPPKRRAFLGPGTWNVLDVRLANRQVTVQLNGQLVLENVPLKGATHRDTLRISEDQPGPIMLQRQLTASEVRFRNIRVRRLESPER